MSDLFSNPSSLEPVQITNAEVYYQDKLDLGDLPDAILTELIADTPWRQENVVVWGKVFKQPRLVAWYGDAGKAYQYSGVLLDPLPWTRRLNDIKEKVEAATNTRFNSVLLNYYRDNNDSMGFHSDDEKELGPKPTIASITLGSNRPFVFKHKQDHAAKPIRMLLSSGSLLLMKGDTQQNYKHGISKERLTVGPRVNLTFRTIRI